jgi:hypothetical protein
VYLPPGATLGKMIVTEAGSSIYVQRDGIIAHNSFATAITNNGTIHWTGDNSILAQDGTSALPAFSFGTQETLGLYKYSSTGVGLSGNLLLTNSGAVLNMGVPTGANNPSINFFSSNTGSYSTAPSRIQAYGGTGAVNSGTIELNGASYIFGSSGTVSVNNTTASTSNTTGGLLVSGGIGISNTTEATSATNGGTITTAGGVGIAKKLFIGGTINTADTTASTSNTTGSITTAGGIGISNTTEATSRTNGGTLTSAGGAGVAKRLFVGGNVYSYGTSTGTNDVAQLVLGPAPSATNFDYCSQIRSLSSSGSNFGSQLQFYTHGGTSTSGDGTVRMTIGNAGTVSITSTTASTNNTTGSITTAGGIAISNTTDAVSATNGGTITTAGGVGIAKQLFVAGITNSTNTTASTSNTTGGLLVSGGIGISNTTDAVSATNGGTITTAGGVGIAKKLFVGTDLDVIGTLTKGAGSFVIPHPDENKRNQGYKLKHCFVESNTRGDNIYRYNINISYCFELDLPDYFDLLNENPQVFVSAKNVLGYGFGVVDKNKVSIKVNVPGEYNILVIGTRKDEIAYNFFDKKGGAEFV